MPHTSSRLIQALRDPANAAALFPQLQQPGHPFGPELRLIETHAAWVLLAGPDAYKLKKPVNFGFLDYSTPALRQAACEAELRLNRRFAPADPAAQIFLEVLPIVGSLDAPRWGPPGPPGRVNPNALGHAVHMRRFDQNMRLDHLCQQQALTPEHLQALAQRLVQFQAESAVAEPKGPLAQLSDPASGMHFARDNLDTLQALFQAPADAQRLQALRQWNEAEYQRLRPLLLQRAREGRVREGHGDLHLANLVCWGGEVLPFDGIEFNEALRWIDTASDIAFTWMDLLSHGQPGLANRFFSDYLDASGDPGAAEVLPFFAAYRALVRAKVAALRWQQLGGAGQAGSDAATALAEVWRGVALAERIAHPPQPQLVITHGLSGCGKTQAANAHLLQANGPTIRLRSDVERKRLHGLAPLARSGSAINQGLYSAEAHQRTYQHLLERSAELLAQGWSVVVDAAFLRRAERAEFAALAARLGLDFQILAPSAPVAELRRRILARQAAGQDASEATLAVLEQQLAWWEPLEELAPPAPPSASPP